MPTHQVINVIAPLMRVARGSRGCGAAVETQHAALIDERNRFANRTVESS